MGHITQKVNQPCIRCLTQQGIILSKLPFQNASAVGVVKKKLQEARRKLQLKNSFSEQDRTVSIPNSRFMSKTQKKNEMIDRYQSPCHETHQKCSEDGRRKMASPLYSPPRKSHPNHYPPFRHKIPDLFHMPVGLSAPLAIDAAEPACCPFLSARSSSSSFLRFACSSCRNR